MNNTPSNSFEILTSHWDDETQKWHEATRASHPYITVRLTKINPHQRNKREKASAELHLMADSGAMCSILNYDSVRAMGLDPDTLELSSVCITGVNGKQLESQTRQMCVEISNKKTGKETWEKIYVSP